MAAMRDSTRRRLLGLHLALIGDRVPRRYHDLEFDGFEPVGSQFNAVCAPFDRQFLEGSIEAVDDADVVAIDVDLRVRRFDFQPQRTNPTVRLVVTRAVATA